MSLTLVFMLLARRNYRRVEYCVERPEYMTLTNNNKRTSFTMNKNYKHKAKKPQKKSKDQKKYMQTKSNKHHPIPISSVSKWNKKKRNPREKYISRKLNNFQTP